MDTFDDQDDTQFADHLYSQRETIRESLDAIANDIGMAMRDVGLRFPVYITVRASGDSLATIATPLDPSDMTGHVHQPSSAKSYRRGLVAADCAGGNCLARLPMDQ